MQEAYKRTKSNERSDNFRNDLPDTNYCIRATS